MSYTIVILEQINQLASKLLWQIMKNKSLRVAEFLRHPRNTKNDN
jgi:hypothetical protein